jgi:hypothetical protein
LQEIAKFENGSNNNNNNNNNKNNKLKNKPLEEIRGKLLEVSNMKVSFEKKFKYVFIYILFFKYFF